MRRGTIVGMISAGIVTLAVSVATGAGGLMMWALALNGFMGQERAVNASMISYFVLAVISGLATVGLSVAAVYLLSGRRNWNAAGSTVLSIVVFAVTSGVLHTACVIVSAIVASALRTGR